MSDHDNLIRLEEKFKTLEKKMEEADLLWQQLKNDQNEIKDIIRLIERGIKWIKPIIYIAGYFGTLVFFLSNIFNNYFLAWMKK